MDVGIYVRIWKKTDLVKARIQRLLSLPHIVPRIRFLLHYFKPAKNALFQTTSPRIRMFFSFNESAFRPYETSESTHQNRIFLKPLSEVVKKTVHNYPG